MGALACRASPRLAPRRTVLVLCKTCTEWGCVRGGGIWFKSLPRQDLQPSAREALFNSLVGIEQLFIKLALSRTCGSDIWGYLCEGIALTPERHTGLQPSIPQTAYFGLSLTGSPRSRSWSCKRMLRCRQRRPHGTFNNKALLKATKQSLLTRWSTNHHSSWTITTDLNISCEISDPTGRVMWILAACRAWSIDLRLIDSIIEPHWLREDYHLRQPHAHMCRLEPCFHIWGRLGLTIGLNAVPAHVFTPAHTTAFPSL